MRIQLQINSLGPIRDATIDLGQMMLFTGMSNLGKSYTNFLCYYVFRVFANNRLHRFLEPKMSGHLAEDADFSVSFTMGDLRRWLHDDVTDFFIKLFNTDVANCDITFLFPGYDDSNRFVFSVKDVPEQRLSERIKVYQISYKDIKNYAIFLGEYTDSNISSRIAQILREEFFERRVSRAFLMPPGRSVLIGNTYSVQSAATSMGLYDIFLRDFDFIRHYTNEQEPQDKQFFNSRIQKLVRGQLLQDKDGVRIVMPNGTPLPLSAAASSIRELSPILFWLQSQDIRTHSMCIEEPEAHAHPEMQADIADLLAACIAKGAMLQVTTHSDYLLHRFNQLIRLYQIRRKNVNAVSRILEKYRISPRSLLNPDNVVAYYFHDEGDKVLVDRLNATKGIPFRSFSEITRSQYLLDEEIEQTLQSEHIEAE